MDKTYEFSYSFPMAYLPANSKLPVHQINASLADNDSFRSTLLNVVQEAKSHGKLLEEHLVGAPELTNRVLHLHDTIRQAYTSLEPYHMLLAQTETHKTSEEAIEAEVGDSMADLALGYTIYDRYFNVIRVKEMADLQFVGQISATCISVLADIPFTILALDEVIVIVQCISMMFKHFTDPHLETPETPDSLIESTNWLGEYQGLWSNIRNQYAGEPHARSANIAMYRWKVGHHLFNLLSIFCIENLIQASAHFKGGEERQGISHLNSAKRFLRGTTAAMWYAANFPGTVYQTIIRPTMIQEETPDGFSGEQNAEYNRLKDAKVELKQTVHQVYGTQPNNWPRPVYSAVRDFVETDTLDCEHHVLIAAAMAGLDASIAQKVWQSELAQETRKLNATDLLRQMAILRRSEFGV